jgi:hypothetical protein
LSTLFTGAKYHMHNHWIKPLRDFDQLAVESTTTPLPVAKPKVADLWTIQRWQTKTVSGDTFVEHLHDKRGSEGQVWAGMFAFSDANKDDDMSRMDIDVAAAAGASKDGDSPIDPAAPSTPARRLVAAREFKL